MYWLLDFISMGKLFLMGHRYNIAMEISGPGAVSESEFSWLEVKTIFPIIWWLGADLAVHDGTPRRHEDDIDLFSIV